MEADIRHYVSPTADMFGECGYELAVVQVLPKEHDRLTAPALYGYVQQLHEHARPVKARYAVSKGHNQSENMHRHLYITDVTKQREREIGNTKPIDWQTLSLGKPLHMELGTWTRRTLSETCIHRNDRTVCKAKTGMSYVELCRAMKV